MGAALRIGVLLPRSSLRPRLGQDFLAGMRLRLAQAREGDPQVELLEADIGLGQSLVSARARELLARGADVLTGVMGINVAAMLRESLAPGDLLLACDLGANLARDWELHPSTFQNSFNYWQASFAMGCWASEHVGKRALLVYSLYESGYDTPYAFQLGVEAAGGEVLHTRVTHVPPDKGGFGILEEIARDLRPDYLYALYDGKRALDFVRWYAASTLAGRVPLLGAGLLVRGPPARAGRGGPGDSLLLPLGIGIVSRRPASLSERLRRADWPCRGRIRRPGSRGCWPDPGSLAGRRGSTCLPSPGHGRRHHAWPAWGAAYASRRA